MTRKEDRAFFIALILIVLTMIVFTCCIPHYPLGLGSVVMELNPAPAEYYEYYGEILRCTGKSRDDYPFDRLKWFVSDELYNTETEKEIWGLFRQPDTIYLHIDAWKNEYVVKHEMLHYFGYSHLHANLERCAWRNTDLPQKHPAVVPKS